MYTSVFIAALFTISRTLRQPKCSLTYEWIKMWCIYTMEYDSATQRRKIGSFVVMWMDLESVIQSEVKSEREKYCTLMHVYRI